MQPPISFFTSFLGMSYIDRNHYLVLYKTCYIMHLLYNHVLAYALAYTFLQLFMLEVRSFQICECKMNICCYFDPDLSELCGHYKSVHHYSSCNIWSYNNEQPY